VLTFGRIANRCSSRHRARCIGARDQTLSLSASADGATFTTVKASATYTFSPSNGNSVTVTFPATAQRYWRITITANTGWPAGQVCEFQIWSQ
jgi:F5/8 type C domain